MHLSDENELEKIFAQEIRQVKVPELAVPPTGPSPQLPLRPTADRLGLKPLTAGSPFFASRIFYLWKIIDIAISRGL